MLVSGDTVVVIGYSYERGGTEVGLFNITDKGRLSYRSTYHRARRLLLVAQLREPFSWQQADLLRAAVSVSRHGRSVWIVSGGASLLGAQRSEFKRIVAATSVYHPESEFDTDYGMALHTVHRVRPRQWRLRLQRHVCYWTSGARVLRLAGFAYIWTSSWARRAKDKPQSIVFRMPLDGSGPSALRASGSPVDQFSFLQSEDQHLNVLLRSESSGDGMWARSGPRFTCVDACTGREFLGWQRSVPASSYRRLQKPEGYISRIALCMTI